MHLLIGAKPGLLNTFFSLVKKRLCSPGPKHCLNVEAVVLCTLGNHHQSQSQSCRFRPWNEVMTTCLVVCPLPKKYVVPEKENRACYHCVHLLLRIVHG